MAYANSLDTNRRLATLTVVAGLHALAGYALVTGLAAKFLPRIAPSPLVADNFRLPPPPPRPVPEPRDAAPLPKAVPTHDARQLLPLDDAPIAPSSEALIDTIGTGGAGGDIAEVHIPLPEPRPSPSLVRGARPRGNPGLWVTASDYPAADLRQEHTGVTRFRLDIGIDGRVSQCTVTGSSGHPGLDAAACARLAQRARFDPAIDSTGARLAGTYASSVRWEIPE